MKHKNRILIVDDIPKNLQILGSILDAKGFDICFATRGEQALSLAENNLPDLILLDISMPDMDGYEVCIRLKKNKILENIPVIFLTAHTDMETMVKAFRIGGQDFVTKPFKPEELMARVNTHLELKEKREEIEQQAQKLSEANQIQRKLNSDLKTQRNAIEQKNKSLTDSLNYAKFIQDSMLSTAQKLKHFVNNSFIVYLPKDIVSGDFYFFEKIKVDTPNGMQEKIVIAVADCTGHGVPGALLTMLGMSVLKQIVVYEKNCVPSEILQKLNMEVSDMLVNKEHNERASDGMDIAICVISPEKSELAFSSCKLPLYLIRDNALVKYSGCIHAIGGVYYTDKKNFENHTITLCKGDRIYMFSDGYSDQFGGGRNKKFNRKKFRQLLIESSTYDMSIQKQTLINAHLKWKADNEQVDDITVLGLEY